MRTLSFNYKSNSLLHTTHFLSHLILANIHKKNTTLIKGGININPSNLDYSAKDFHLSGNNDLSEEEEEEKEHKNHEILQEHPHQLGFHGLYRQSDEITQSPRFEEKIQNGFKKSSSKLKVKNAREKVREIHGGRTVQSLGRKDRHSKVCTAKGPKDRRVRLSPNTAIEFYDVQDRLGYDRPSKAIDWLLKEAKVAIDALHDSTHPTHDHDFDNLLSMASNDRQNSPVGSFQDLNQLDIDNPSTSHFMSLFSIINGEGGQGLSTSFDQNYQNGSFPTTTSSTSLANEDSFPFQFPPLLGQNHILLQREPLQSTLCPINASSSMQFYSTIGFSNDELTGFEEQNPTSRTSFLQE